MTILIEIPDRLTDHMTIRALPAVLLTATLFGSTLVASRFSVGEFDPLVYIAIRLVIASLCFVLIYRWREKRPFPTDRVLWLRASFLGVYGTAINLWAIVFSLQYLSAGTASIFMTLIPAAIIFLAQFFLPDERLNLRQWIGVTLAFLGAITLAISGESGIPDVSSADPRGYILMFIAIVTVSTSSIFARIYLRDYPSTDVASIRMFTAMIVFVGAALIFADVDLTQISAQAYFATLYAALTGTFGGFFAQFYTIQKYGAVPAAMINYTMPIVAGIGGVLVLGETLTSSLIAGFLIILMGIILSQKRA